MPRAAVATAAWTTIASRLAIRMLALRFTSPARGAGTPPAGYLTTTVIANAVVSCPAPFVVYGAGMFETRVLENGVRVLSAPMRDAPSVAVVVGVAAGSRFERPEAAGIAHFAEHMFFKGTTRRPSARDIAGEIDGIGGEFNAFTGKELTAYYVKCAAASAPIAVDVLGDMLLDSRFDEGELEREKGVIVEEINMYLDTPRDLIGQVWDELRYGDTPLGRPIIGTKETVRAATRQTFLDYLADWYRPERLVIGLGGAVDEALIEDVSQRFGALEAVDTPARPETVLPREQGPLLRVERRDSDQAHIVLGTGGLPIDHPDRYVISVLQTVLGGGMSSRLFTEVRERRGLAYYVFASHNGYTDAGSLVVRAGVDTARAPLAVETITAELRRLAEEPVGDAELGKARRYLTGRLVLGLEEPRGTIMFGLRRLLLEGRTAELDEVVEGIEAVTADDVQRLAGELMRPERLTLAAIGPLEEEPLRDALSSAAA
jgi:predicted Zn-dependent peptidase